MRPLVAALFCCSIVLVSHARGEQTFPYRTYIAADDVYVRSGPGQNYYPTSKLKRGAEVEVYRHDPGGWCAIRPVEGSFTWVSSRFLKPTEDRLAVITEDGVQSRVGSEFQRHPRRGSSTAAQGRDGGSSRSAVARAGPGRQRVGQNRAALRRVPLGFQQVSRRGVPREGVRSAPSRSKRLAPIGRRRIGRTAKRFVRRRAFRRHTTKKTTSRSARNRRGPDRFQPESSRPNWIASRWNCRSW